MADRDVDVVVVGAGLAGLAAATVAARAGRRVLVVEGRADVGGRARSHQSDGFTLNQGPHALYRGGGGIRVLRDLGIRPRGGTPSYGHPYVTRDRQLIAGLSGAALGARGKRQLLAALGPGARRRVHGQTVASWIDQLSDPPPDPTGPAQRDLPRWRLADPGRLAASRGQRCGGDLPARQGHAGGGRR